MLLAANMKSKTALQSLSLFGPGKKSFTRRRHEGRIPAPIRRNSLTAQKIRAIGVCSAPNAAQDGRQRRQKPNQINAVSNCDAILTRWGALSMVRPAFEGDGAPFSVSNDIVSGLHMAEGAGEEGNGSRDKSSDEAALSARLKSLDQRLSDFRGSRKVGTDRPEGDSEDGVARASAMSLGLRLSSELIAGVLVGAAVGWGFDRLLSTSPFGLIVFVLLGFVAGVVNVVRSAGAGSGQDRPPSSQRKPD